MNGAEISMQRFRFPLLALLTTVIAMLFFGDFLTGRDHQVFQDPYSRLTRVIERKYGLSSSDGLQTNPMSEYYFNQLKQKHGEPNWQPAPNSFTIKRFTGRREEDTAPIAPVIDLDPNREVYFLCALRNDKVRLAVIHSLFHTRSAEADPAARGRNAQWEAEEAARMRLITWWVEFGSKDPTTSPTRWWNENAKFFGLTPDGDSLSAPKAVLLQ